MAGGQIGEAFVKITPQLSNFESETTAGVTKGLSGAESATTSTAAKMRKAFSGAFANLASTGVLGPFAEVFDKVNEIVDQTGEHSKKLGATLMGTGAVVTGLGAVMTKEADKDKQAHLQLQQAITNTGKSYADYKEEIEKTITSQEHYGHTADDTQEALQKLTQATQDPKKALEDMTLVANLAAAKHMSLADAAGLVAKAYGGSTRIFKDFGMNITAVTDPVKALATAEKSHSAAVDAVGKAQDAYTLKLDAYNAKTQHTAAETAALQAAHQKLTDAQDKAAASQEILTKAQETAKHPLEEIDANLAKVADRLNGQAAAASDTFTGKMNALRAHLTDVANTLFTNVGPALMKIGPLMGGVGAIIESGVLGKVGNAVKGLGDFSGKMAGFAVDMAANVGKMAVSVATWAAETIASAATAVAAWVADMAAMVASSIASAAAVILPWLPLILLLAAIGVAAYELYEHWDQVWGFIKQVGIDAWNAISAAFTATWNAIKDFFVALWDGIKKYWLVIVAVLFGPVGILILAIVEIKKHWEAIWTAVKDFFVAIWSAIKSAFTTALNGIKAAASAAFNAVKTVIEVALNAIKALFQIELKIIVGIFSAVWNGLKTIVSTAMKLVEDVIHGKWGDILSFIKSIPGKILSALGDLGSLLKNAGAKLIEGFVHGIVGAFDSVKNTLGGLTSKLTSWKGPPDKDVVLLRSSGNLVIKGFTDGLREKFADVQGTLGDLTAQVQHHVVPAPRMAALAAGASTGNGSAGMSAKNNTHVEVHSLTLQLQGAFNLTNPVEQRRAAEQIRQMLVTLERETK